MPLTIKQMSEAMAAGSQGENPYAKGVVEERQAKLKDYLSQKADENKLQRDKAALVDLQKNTPEGSSLHVGELSAGADPYMKQLGKGMQGEEAARKNAVKYYNDNSKNMNDILDASKTGLGALQSNDNSSLGQVRAAMLSANGFKRFNEPEALANAPDSVKSQISGLLNKYGLDTPNGNMSDQQRGSITKFFNNKLDEMQDHHNMLKSQALSTYQTSSYAKPEGSQAISGLGSPIDTRINSLKNQFDKFHSEAVPSQPATGSNAPSGSGFDNIKSGLSQLFGGLRKQPQPVVQPAQQQMAPQAPAASGGFDPNAIQAEIQRRAALKQQGGLGGSQ